MTIVLVITAITLVCVVGMLAPDSNALAALTIVFLVFALIRASDERMARRAVATDSTPPNATDSTPPRATDSTNSPDPTTDTHSTLDLARKVERQTERLLYKVIELRVRQVCPEAGPIFEDLYLPDAGVESSPASESSAAESSAAESSASSSAKDADECGWCSENFLEDDSMR